jgi:integrase/recombinase XerD
MKRGKMSEGNVYNKIFNKEIYEKVNKDNKDLLEDFLMELKQNKKSDGTIYQYRCDINSLFIYIYKHFDNKSILELNKRDFRNYSLYLTNDCKLSSARHNRMMSALRSLLTFAENEEDYEYDNNVSKKVKGLSKEPVRDIFFLTNDEIIRMKNELIKREEYQKATLLMLAYDSAGRKAELSQVEKNSFFYPNKNNTNKVIGKRRKVFSLIYFSGTKECAALWLKQRGEDDINSLWIVGDEKTKRTATKEVLYDWFMHLRKIYFELEGKKINFNVHTIRHSALENYSMGTHYVCKELNMENGFPVEKLRLIANHSDISTTQGYLKDKSIDELENMFNIELDD